MNAHALTAHRARLLGNLVRTATDDGLPNRATLAASAHLHDASAALLDETRAPAGRVPEPAATALNSAARAMSAASLPAIVLGYVTAPITGEMPDLPPLHLPPSTVRAREGELRSWRLSALDRINDRDDDMAIAALEALLDVHTSWVDLVAHLHPDVLNPQ